ncbi:hypothetical protein BWK47_12750 [Synechocystis sp. CACIAM 05]|nr:hypothetical protein BWK47_12750 [Synechocystis sp. CACIAM 05]
MRCLGNDFPVILLKHLQFDKEQQPLKVLFVPLKDYLMTPPYYKDRKKHNRFAWVHLVNYIFSE